MKPEIELPAQFGRQLQRLTLWTDDDRKCGHENKNQADRQQHLVELAGPVEPAIEKLLKHYA